MEKDKEHLEKLLAEIEELQEKIRKTKAETAKIREKNDALRAKIEEVKAENRIMLRERGWEGITDEEMEWVMANGAKYYFKLKLHDIRRLMKKEKDENIS